MNNSITEFHLCLENIERELAQLGWDQAPALFALVNNQWLLESIPDSDDTPSEDRQLRESLLDNPGAMTAVLQDSHEDMEIEELINLIVFPEHVVGAALSIERIVVPPSVSDQAPDDPEKRDDFLMNHPQRDDIRVVAGVLRSGEKWCVIRSRSYDKDAAIITGDDLIDDLPELLMRTLTP
ncbi:MAG: PPA1309 family protein [Actinomycetaceae bacterium]|nr:PPA1309 family protein [Actinomycetaceae bacterium]